METYLKFKKFTDMPLGVFMPIDKYVLATAATTE